MAYYNYSPRYGLDNYSFVFPFEHTFDSVKSTVWMQENWHHSITMSVFYIIAIYLGRKLMESRKPYTLDFPLFLWNFGLAVFSIMGVVRMTPEMFWSVNSNSFVYSICTASFAQGVTGYWTEKFAMSKVWEFGDTAFIVLRKRPLLFLHWYHHITVLVYTWHAYKDHTASGRWFIWMNYAVHAFMYSYYAIRALKIRVPKSCAMIVTLLQLAQMVVGVYIGIVIYGLKSAGKPCQQTWSNLYFSFSIYFSYFLLFCNFFYHAYLKKNNRYVEKPVSNPKEQVSEKKMVENDKSQDQTSTEPESQTRKRRPQRQNFGLFACFRYSFLPIIDNILILTNVQKYSIVSCLKGKNDHWPVNFFDMQVLEKKMKWKILAHKKASLLKNYPHFVRKFKSDNQNA
uniref:Elongation of very long chain fatty acids protein n=1 Tax=Panagrolaimus sp. JU765 TaxID=591449 RepID=A0AC34QUD4_9BILA